MNKRNHNLCKKIFYTYITIFAVLLLMGKPDFIFAASNNVEAEASSVQITEKKSELMIKESMELTLSSKPRGVKYQWSSSNTSIATVTLSGKVKGIKEGKAQITCKITYKSKLVNTLKKDITVIKPNVSSIKISQTQIKITQGTTKKINAYTEPKEAKNNTIFWETTNSRIAQVSSDGIVHGISGGTANIIARTSNGITKLITVIVNPKKEPAPIIEELKFEVEGDFVSKENSGKITYLLDKDTTNAVIEIQSEKNETVYSITLDKSPKYKETFWDGTGYNKNPVKEGYYCAKLILNGRTKKSKKLYVYEKNIFGGGIGTKENPYIIKTTQHLNSVRDFNNRHFLQASDLDMKGVSFSPLFSSRKKFEGSYNGAGYKIKSLTINNDEFSYTGLFSGVSEDGIVKDIRLTDVTIAGGKYTGAIVGKNSGYISGCTVSGFVAGKSNVGVICGTNEGSIRDSNGSAYIVTEKSSGLSFERY